MLALCVTRLVSLAAAGEPPITSVAFAPDGNSIVATSQSGLQVYNYPELAKVKTIQTKASNLHCVAFSPNGKQLAVGGGDPSEAGIVEIFSWPETQSHGTFTEHSDSVLSVVWRDDSTLITSSLDREIKLWKVGQKKSVRTFAGHSGGVSTICLVADGETLVSSGQDQSVRVWDVRSGELTRTLNQHTQQVHAIAVRPAGTGLPMVATAAADRTIRFWQPTIGRMARYVRLDSEPLNISWLNETQIAASCVDGHVRIVNADEVKVLHDVTAIKGWAYAIAVHPTSGGLVVAGPEGQIFSKNFEQAK